MLAARRCVTAAQRRHFAAAASSPGSGARAKNPTLLKSPRATVHLLGTMHIATASAEATRSLIRAQHATGRLGAIALELDGARAARLRGAARPDDTLLAHLQSVAARARANGTGPLAGALEVAMGGMYRVLHRLGFAGGLEFQTALVEADALDVPIVLIDRDVAHTMSRVADAVTRDLQPMRLLSLMQAGVGVPPRPETDVQRRARAAFTDMLRGDVAGAQRGFAELIDREAVAELVTPMREVTPSIATAILDERDVYMADQLVRAVAKLPDGKDSVVAVVGMAHVDGIVAEWRHHGMEDPLER